LKPWKSPLDAGREQLIPISFSAVMDESRFAFVCLLKNEEISVHLSDQRVTGVLALCQTGNKAVAKSSIQSPPPGIGIDTFEFWTPKRRPAGKNLAMRIEPAIRAFAPANLTNGISRPSSAPNAWVADFSHEQPVVRLTWDTPQTIGTIEIDFDTDFDHPMESVLMGHPERDMPYCIRDLKLAAALSHESQVPSNSSAATLTHTAVKIIGEVVGNHQTRRIIRLEAPVTTACLELQILVPSISVPAALFAVRCFSETE
jgi:hypothetical protein